MTHSIYRAIYCWAFALFAISASAQTFNISSYGAVGDGTTLNTTAIQNAVDACHNSGGGKVVVPPGNFLTATIVIKSNVEFYLDSGATITGSSVIADYPVNNYQKRTYTDNYTQRSLFFAEGQHHISITGKGTINGNGQSISFLLDGDNKPYGFRFASCSNVLYDGVTLLHSGFWMMHNFDIDTLTIRNLTIVNHGFGNNDAINIDGCKNVLVENCTVDANNDPVVIKTTSPISSENIEVRNCTVATYARALKIGTETNGAVKNVYFHDCTVQYSTLGPFGGSTPANCGINLSIVDGGSMENVLMEDITMSGINTPIFIRLGNRARKYTDTAATPGVGFINNVELNRITATAASNISSSVTGIANHEAENIRIKNSTITYPGGMNQLYPSFIVPEDESGKPEADMFGDTLPAAGFFVRHVNAVQFVNVCFNPLQADGRPNYVFEQTLNADTSITCGMSGTMETDKKPILMFPNPATEMVEVFADGMLIENIKLYTTEGALLKQMIGGCMHCTMSLAALPDGLYTVCLDTDMKRVFGKLIINNR